MGSLASISHAGIAYCIDFKKRKLSYLKLFNISLLAAHTVFTGWALVPIRPLVYEEKNWCFTHKRKTSALTCQICGYFS